MRNPGPFVNCNMIGFFKSKEIAKKILSTSEVNVIDITIQFQINTFYFIQRHTSNIYTTVFWIKRLKQSNTRKPWYKWFVTGSHAILHLGRWSLHGSLRVTKLKPRFKVCRNKNCLWRPCLVMDHNKMCTL